MGKLRDRFRRMIGRPGTADLTRFRAVVQAAGGLEDEMRGLGDGDMAVRAADAGARGPDDDHATPAELVALGREAARRGIGERAFDVQLLGTLGLLSGHVVEMATGEGKTLSGALAAAGHALRGRRVHVITINDYLARRDAEWMGPVYDLLGVTVGWVDQSSTHDERRAAYTAQVTYAPVSEVGFDVLRDRMITDPADAIVPEPDVAIIDEADSVLVDEARVPLVLAGSVSAGAADPAFAEIVKGLRKTADFEIGEDGRSVHLTPAGTHKVEDALDGIDLYTTEHVDTLAKVNLALHARALLQRDVDYIVRDGRVQLINESRGRVAVLQRWPDGLQAAVEAKEGLAASESGEILDSITVQALLRRYRLLSGMTGTAVAVAEQFREFYELEVAVIPPNVPCVRDDEPDRLYATVEDKEAALLQQIAGTHATGRPILVGTLDVAESERIAHHLKRRGIKCEVLNAKNDAEEAAIIAEAGTYGAITVSTQMAGRGTDIRLGGSDGADHERIAGLGGLYVMGLGRHPSSRLDDQLRGRAGRQGDPGSSVMFTSLRDDLVAHHAPGARLPDGDQADGRVRGKGALELVGHAQRVAEGVHLETHRNTWRYNKLIEHQRGLVLKHRDRLLHGDLARRQLAEDRPERAKQIAAEAGEEAFTKAARLIALYHLDRCWTEHLGFLDNLREGIHLRSLGRLNPLDEFHKEAIAGWNALLPDARSRAAQTLETAKITENGVDLAAEGLRRPTSTWTYMVSDTPFGTEAERALRRLSSALRRS